MRDVVFREPVGQRPGRLVYLPLFHEEALRVFERLLEALLPPGLGGAKRRLFGCAGHAGDLARGLRTPGRAQYVRRVTLVTRPRTIVVVVAARVRIRVAVVDAAASLR